MARARSRPDRKTDRIDLEIQYHLRRTVEEFVAAGHSEDEARRLAVERFGDFEYYRKRLRKLQGGGWNMSLKTLFERLGDDIRSGWRYARRSPGLTVGVSLTIALGVGANATMYSVIDRILLTAPPHIDDAARVKRLLIERSFLGRQHLNTTMTYPDFQDWRAAESFASVAAYTRQTVTIGTGEFAARAAAVFVTHDFLPLLRTAPHSGRFFTAEDDVETAEPVAVLGYDFWHSQFGGRDDVLGTTLDLGHAQYRVVGIAPRGFTGVDLDRVDLWLPLLTYDEVEIWKESRGYFFVRAIARLAPNSDVTTAGAEATLLHRRGRASDNDYDPQASVRVSPLLMARGPTASNETVVAKWLAGVSLFVLIIACSNVVNLLLAHAARHRRETAVRLALGVGRARLIGQLLLGSLTFALLGAAGALLIARWGGMLVGRVLLPDVDWSAGVINPRVLTFTAVFAVLASLATGLFPALRTGSSLLVDDLAQGGRGASGRRSPMRSSLLLAQATLSMILLIGSGLFVKSLRRVELVDLGFDPDNVYVLDMELPAGNGTLLATPAARHENTIQTHVRLLERLRRVPFVQSASVTNTIPFRNTMSLDVRVSGREELPQTTGGGPYALVVTPDYHRVMDLDLLKGRSITSEDVLGAPRVAVVTSATERLMWPDNGAIGQCLYILERHIYADPNLTEAPCTEVVGVVEDSHRQAVIEDEQMLYYLPQAQVPLPPRGLVVRTSLPEDRAVPELRQLAFDAVPEARFIRVSSMNSLVDPDFRSWRLGASVFTAFGFLALIVAAVGLYSVLSFDVAQRRKEIGVRTALGATATRLVHWIVRGGVGLVAVGVTAGGLIAAIAGGPLQSLLYETSVRDTATYAIVAGLLCVVAVLASLIPALRATRIPPMEALRLD